MVGSFFIGGQSLQRKSVKFSERYFRTPRFKAERWLNTYSKAFMTYSLAPLKMPIF